MSEIALRVVSDASPRYVDADSSYYSRIPDEILSSPEVSDAEVRVLLAFVKLCKGGYDTDATDAQAGRICGKSSEAVQRSVRGLDEKGIIDRSGGGRFRRVRLLFRFKLNSARSDGVSSSSTTTEVTTHSARSDGVGHHGSRSTPSEVTTLPRRLDQKEIPRTPTSSSSPRVGDTPTSAKARETPPDLAAPPPPCLPPVIEARRLEARETAIRDAVLQERWDALPLADREAIQAKVRDANPALSNLKPIILSLCMAEMAAADPVEAVPTDRELRAAIFMLDATDPLMRVAAAKSLCDWGRSDLVADRIGFEFAKRDGRRPLSGSSATSKSPSRSPS